MKKPYYTLARAIADTREALLGTEDFSDTTLRCAINDTLERASREGHRIPAHFNQEMAVKRLRRWLRVS